MRRWVFTGGGVVYIARNEKVGVYWRWGCLARNEKVGVYWRWGCLYS